jgi:hypothetical protein
MRFSGSTVVSQHPRPELRPAADDPARDHEHAVAGLVQRLGYFCERATCDITTSKMKKLYFPISTPRSS